jgi:mono/diheme cytochrome c family protein
MQTRRWLAALVVAVASTVVTLTGCTPPVGGGDATAGQTKFNASCVNCHSAASLRGTASFVTNDLGTLTPAMTGITLTDQEVADVRAYLLTQ